MTAAFHVPTRVVLRRGALDGLGDVVRPLGATALVLLGGGSARRTGVADRVLRGLAASGVRTVVVDGVSPNPRVDEVDAARRTARRAACDVVVAVGGGSVMDAGKVVAVRADVASVADLLRPGAGSGRGLPLVVVPTVAGSGAEVTKGAILTDVARAARGGVRGEHLFPAVAVVDPALHAAVPPRHAVAAAFDCFTHAVEALVAVGRSPVTDELAARTLGLVGRGLDALSRRDVTDGVLDDLALASVLGGMCVANASTCLPHRLQQAMGAVPEVHVSHGDGLAALYPAWLDHVAATAPGALLAVADALGTPDVPGAVRRLLASVGLDRTLTDLGFGPAHLPRLVAGVTGNLANDPTHRPAEGSAPLLALYDRSLRRTRDARPHRVHDRKDAPMSLDLAPRPPQTVMLNPGPVNTDPRVRAVAAYPDVCHREPEVAALMDGVRSKLTAVAGGTAEHTTVLLTGSGTAALEATVASVVPASGRLLVVDNGHYGERVHDVAVANGVPVTRLDLGWGSAVDVGALEAALDADPGVTHVALVHHETSTGRLNPLREVGELVSRRGLSLIVDAISSLGCEDLDVVADHVDWCVGTANKCLEGLPGTSFVTARRSAFRGLADLGRRTYYLDLHRHFVAQDEQGAPAFTPAVQVLYALDVAVSLTLEETVAGRHRRYADRAAQVRRGVEALGLRLLLEEDQRACSVTHVLLPDGLAYEDLHDRLKADGFVIYSVPAQVGRVFRVATMGQVTEAQVERFLGALAAALAPVPAGR